MEGVSETQSDPASKLWLKAYEELCHIDRFLFLKTLDLVQEAAGCHKSRFYVASAVMCRGALESMLHTLKAWRREGARYCLGRVVRARLVSLIKWSVGDGVMTPRQAKMASHIKEMGDLSAHIAQRIDEERYKDATNKPYRLWVNERESWKLLKDTVELLSALANKRYMKLTKFSSTQ